MRYPHHQTCGHLFSLSSSHYTVGTPHIFHFHNRSPSFHLPFIQSSPLPHRRVISPLTGFSTTLPHNLLLAVVQLPLSPVVSASCWFQVVFPLLSRSSRVAAERSPHFRYISHDNHSSRIFNFQLSFAPHWFRPTLPLTPPAHIIITLTTSFILTTIITVLLF